MQIVATARMAASTTRRSGPGLTDQPATTPRRTIFAMATCTSCGGRGGSYDGQGNWMKCQTCGGSGQTNF